MILFFCVMCRGKGASGGQNAVVAEGKQGGLKKKSVKNRRRSLICQEQIRSQKLMVKKLYGVG